MALDSMVKWSKKYYVQDEGRTKDRTENIRSESSALVGQTSQEGMTEMRPEEVEEARHP